MMYQVLGICVVELQAHAIPLQGGYQVKDHLSLKTRNFYFTKLGNVDGIFRDTFNLCTKLGNVYGIFRDNFH